MRRDPGYREIGYVALLHGLTCWCGAPIPQLTVSVYRDETTGEISHDQACAIELVAMRRAAEDARDGLEPLIKEMAS